MTDLEAELIKQRNKYSAAVSDIQAELIKVEGELAELREQMKGGRAKAIEQRDEAQAKLAELREAVRAYLDGTQTEAGFVDDDRLRQLIEEKP